MYSEQFQESLARVEASREKNIALDPVRMTAEQKETVLSSFHPDYKADQFEVLTIGPNKGDKVPRELAEILQAHSRITADSVCLNQPDYETDVLVIGGGGAGASAAIEAHEAGAKVMVVTNLRMGDANTPTQASKKKYTRQGVFFRPGIEPASVRIRTKIHKWHIFLPRSESL